MVFNCPVERPPDNCTWHYPPVLLLGQSVQLSSLLMFRGRLSSLQHRNVKLAPSYFQVGVGVSGPAGNAFLLDPCSLPELLTAQPSNQCPSEAVAIA